MNNTDNMEDETLNNEMMNYNNHGYEEYADEQDDEYYANPNVYEDEADDDAEFESVVSNSKKKRKLWNDSLTADPHFHKIKRIRDYKKVDIGIYSTANTPGVSIRNAVTGTKCGNHRVGSLDELQYYKVKLATGELGRDGYSLFFDSPSQYEKHMLTEASSDALAAWRQRMM